MYKFIVYFVICTGIFFVVQTKCPRDWAEFHQDCLMFSADSKTWDDAQGVCRQHMAFLLTDDSAQKHDFIRQIVSVLDGVRIRNFFIGGNDQSIEGQWRWLETGSPITGFTAWAHDKPSANMSVAMNLNCMMLQWINNDLFWSDWDCKDHSAHYICQKPASSFTNPPVIG